MVASGDFKAITAPTMWSEGYRSTSSPDPACRRRLRQAEIFVQKMSTGPGLTVLDGHQVYGLTANGIYGPFP
jgi:hypothetical protein